MLKKFKKIPIISKDASYGKGVRIDNYCYIHPDHSDVAVTNNINMFPDFIDREDITALIIERSVPRIISQAFNEVSDLDGVMGCLFKNHGVGEYSKNSLNIKDANALAVLDVNIGKYHNYLTDMFEKIVDDCFSYRFKKYEFAGLTNKNDYLHVDDASCALLSSVIGGGTRILKNGKNIPYKKTSYSPEESEKIFREGNMIKVKDGNILIFKQLGLIEKPVVHMSPDAGVRCALVVYN